MTDRPILFSAPMVRALLGGRKTQTRRIHFTQSPVMTPKCDNGCEPRLTKMCICPTCNRRTVTETKVHVGDRLYVREHWRCEGRYDDFKPSDLKDGVPIYYVADPDPRDSDPGCAGRFRQGMHMPRWASRLTLTVTDVRVERLQNISEADAFAEGVWHGNTFNRFADDLAASCQDDRWFPTATDWYRDLWDRINGFAAWEENPWVVAYTFTVIQKNIDEA